VVGGLVEREHRSRMTRVRVAVRVDAPAELVWRVVADPRNLPHWDRHIVGVSLPSSRLAPGATYVVTMAFMGVRARVRCEVLDWEPPRRSRVRLNGVLEATVTTEIEPRAGERSTLRHEVDYEFRGPLGRFAGASLGAVGGAQLALRHGTLAQKRAAEEAARRPTRSSPR
jgi:uncharacterized membrane protein